MTLQENRRFVRAFSMMNRKTTLLRHLPLLLSAAILIVGLAGLSFAEAPSSQTLLASNTNEPTVQASASSPNRIARDFERAIARVQPFLDRYGYPVLFLAVMVEGIGLLAPGQTLLIAAALVAAKGNLNIVWVLIWAFTAAVVGNSLGYLIGRWGGRPLLLKIKVNEKHLERMERYFARYGKGVVIIARFFDGLRQLNGIVAGMLEMPWGVFNLVNILGALLWIGVWGLGTYFLEKEIGRIHHILHNLNFFVKIFALLSFLFLLIYLLWRRKQK